MTMVWFAALGISHFYPSKYPR